MKIAITGASGNIGSSLIEVLEQEDGVDEIVGIARRRPAWETPRTRWVEADILETGLENHFSGVDAVVHLAWAIQPSHDVGLLDRVNVEGSRRVFEAAATAGVGKLVYSSSVGTYAPGPTDQRVDESWSTQGIEASTYSRQKAAVERELDRFEASHPEVKVVRFRPGLIFKGQAASEIRRLFAGPFLPTFLLRRGLIPGAPFLEGLRFQAVHSGDVGAAYAKAVTSDVSGAFNLAAEPIIGPDQISEVLGASAMEAPPGLARKLAKLSWRARLQPSEPGWLDLAMESPLMSTARARSELGWSPGSSATDAMAELIDGLRKGDGHSPPHLARSGVTRRFEEVRTGVGGRQWVRSRGEQIASYLADVHSIEVQARVQMDFAPRIAGDPELARPFLAHRSETDNHESGVLGRLTDLGRGSSAVKDRAGSAGGLGMLLFARSQPDAPGKLVAHAYSYEHMELAAYEILAAFSERSGDHDTASLARQIAGEEREMARRLESSFDRAVDLSTGGDPTERQLLAYLRDTEAIEAQGSHFLARTRSFVDDRHLGDMLGEAGRLVDEHRSRNGSLLESQGEAGPSPIKNSALAAGGNAAATFFRLQPDPNTKIAGFVFAYLNLQVAAYRLLGKVGALAGAPEVVASARQSAAESGAMAGRITGLWRHLGGV